MPHDLRQAARRDLFPGALEMMILRTLERQPMHGYALAQHIKNASDDLLQIEEGSLYPALQRMLREGWLKARGDISATNRRIRIYYADAGWRPPPASARRRASNGCSKASAACSRRSILSTP